MAAPSAAAAHPVAARLHALLPMMQGQEQRRRRAAGRHLPGDAENQQPTGGLRRSGLPRHRECVGCHHTAQRLHGPLCVRALLICPARQHFEHCSTCPALKHVAKRPVLARWLDPPPSNHNFSQPIAAPPPTLQPNIHLCCPVRLRHCRQCVRGTPHCWRSVDLKLQLHGMPQGLVPGTTGVCCAREAPPAAGDQSLRQHSQNPAVLAYKPGERHQL